VQGQPGTAPPPPPGAAPGQQPYAQQQQPGQPPPGYYYPPPPGAYVEPAPPPPPPDTSKHRHDGFYLRMSLGIGYIDSNWETENAAEANAKITGTGIALDLLIGGTPADGFVIGGGLLGNSVANPEIEPEGGSSFEAEGALGASQLGVFVDGFFDPTGGFHVGGMLSIAGYNVQFDDDTPNIQQGGAGAALWVGYDAWVGSQWSIGGALRATIQATSDDRDDFEQQADARTYSLMFTALYH
jgi:hypothetical protein